MKNKFLFAISILVIFFGLCLCADAQDDIKVYNRKLEVLLEHELLNHNGQYYMHISDLGKLGLDVNKEDSTYTITSNDCLGEERKLVIRAMTIEDIFDIETIEPFDGLYTPILMNDTGDKLVYDIADVICDGSYSSRSSETIGYQDDLSVLLENNFSFSGNTKMMIKVNDENYISTKTIGERMSHSYSVGPNKIEFYIADKNSVITETTLNLIGNEKAPLGGYKVNVYTAYKTGNGETIDDFEMLSTTTCIIPENESSISCYIETPADKISNKNIYYIADFGGRYALAYNEFDMSNVGKVYVYGKQKDVTCTINVNLPEIDEKDVMFTVYVEANNETYSKTGMVVSGNLSSNIRVTELPLADKYSSRIEFHYHKYENAYIDDIFFINSSCAVDFETEFYAQLSKEVVCTIRLPDDFVCEEDIEIKLTLKKFIVSGTVSVIDKLKDWEDSQVIILNTEKRSEQVILYNQTYASMLYYTINSNIEGLCKKGYLHSGGKVTSNKDSSKEITNNLTVDIKLLECKNISVKVSRPFSLDVDNDICAVVEFYDVSTHGSDTKTMNFTQTPLIPAGERNCQFEIELPEDKVYTLEIKNITGDDHLFDYCCLVNPYASKAEHNEFRYISFGSNTNSISLTLLKCINVSGRVECVDNNLNFDVIATCQLYNGRIIYLGTEVNNGEFSLKIPYDTDTYTLDAQTIVGKKSYYISDGISTNNKEEATQIFYDTDKAVVINYIPHNPTIPIEISINNKYDHIIFENISDYLIDEFDAYIACYDIKGKLISVQKTECSDLRSGAYYKIPNNTGNYKIKKVKAFAWKKDEIIPLGNTFEINVNMPEKPEQDLSIFVVADTNAVINCEEVILSSVPKEIHCTLYISAEDFEKLGYGVKKEDDEVYIENDNLQFEFVIGENIVFETLDNISHEISAPIMDDDGLIIPVAEVCRLFGNKTEYDNISKRLILNMPFTDIEYSDSYTEAILKMYFDGVIWGYEDGAFKADEYIIRAESARFCSRAMGHSFTEYEFECLDVPFDHWAKSVIGICIDEGIFELEENKFHPNEFLTLEEAIISTVKMKGISSENYFETAKTYGILKNIDVQNLSRNITRAELAQLLYNSNI